MNILQSWLKYVLKMVCKVLHIFFAAQLPRHFVLIPNKSIYVLQGQSGEVTCEAEGPSVSTLKWEKQQDDKSYAAVPKSQVNITKDTKYVRATLKITNAQFADTGTYKCTVSVPPNKSDYKLTKLTVKGMFVYLFFYILHAPYEFSNILHIKPQAFQSHVSSVLCKLTFSQESRCRVTSNRWDFVWEIEYWGLRTVNIIILTYFSIKSIKDTYF